MNNSVRKNLKQQAHALKPVILIGNKGLTEAVHAAIDEALITHELIKIRLSAEDKSQRQQWLETILEQHKADLIQKIGHIAAIYRQNPEKEAVATDEE